MIPCPHCTAWALVQIPGEIEAGDIVYNVVRGEWWCVDKVLDGIVYATGTMFPSGYQFERAAPLPGGALGAFLSNCRRIRAAPVLATARRLPSWGEP